MVNQTSAATRPVALFLGICLALLLSGWLLLALQRAQDDIAPPGATQVRVAYQRLSHVHVSYHIPPEWSLLDLYAYLESQGWTRDSATERGLRQGHGIVLPPRSIFAVFVRRGWFGQARELAIVGIDPSGSRLVHVRQVRCLPLPRGTGC
ncbi:MAG TPA: hypothetical protein VNL77_04565 [Roseiflexaceae bacterium]|nr:hypothetical protein [Roseiflexaceae bacterium]